MSATEIVGVRVNEALQLALLKAASARGCTISALVRIAVVRYLRDLNTPTRNGKQ